ncbi:MAG: UDP-N-acetylmuramoyl-L-alanyl-D-glutamate--2,6-diaminopimelate ligase [Ostreibacterium sp.]
MKIIDLLKPYTNQLLPKVTVTQVINDSRQMVEGCLFLAEQGISSHALDYLTETQYQQSAMIAYQPPYDISRFTKTDKFIAIDDLKTHISAIGQYFYAPCFEKNIIGVTGTNGKTSVTHFIAQLADYGVIGTMGYGGPGQLTELSHTTPDALSVPKILAELSKNYVGVALEVSSHALALHRVSGIAFDVAVFTNLSQDHLDFHQNMADYFAEKSKLFNFDCVKTVVINTDDESGYCLAKDCFENGKRVIAFGRVSNVAEFDEYAHITALQLSCRGIDCQLSVKLREVNQSSNFSLSVWGAFNVNNVLAAMLALYASGESFDELLGKAVKLQGVVGRIEPIDLGDNKMAIIDYSHTPDALINVLSSLRAHTEHKIYAVFGCGGDRDKGKRPLMAEAVNQGADIGIITDDNPRTEKSADIIADILSGDIERERFHVINSRRQAIYFGLEQLASGDILLIAGKGHETYQIVGTERKHFSDQEMVREWLGKQSSRVPS